MSENQDQLKAAAAESAAARVTDGMIVGLGSGSTAALAVSALGRRVGGGLHITGIPTSEATAAQAKALGIPLTTLAEVSSIDMTIDGADEVEQGSLDLIKGLGGALLREKLVATATKALVIVADSSKLVTHLGAHDPIPVEVVPFGWESTAARLAGLGAAPTLRRDTMREVFVTDGGHYILDCRFGSIASAEALASELDHVVGVVEHGLFIGMTSEVHLAGADGVRVLKRRFERR
jgi:ribose 5-phosphate isomerase A